MTDPNVPPADVVIVGSGIAGALVALKLGEGGKNVLVLEAGEPIPTNLNEEMDRFYRATAKVPESAYRPELLQQNPTDPKSPLVDPAKVIAGRPTVLSLISNESWRDPKQSYLIQTGVVPFGSTYERIAGGTSLHWLGTSLRLLPNDFHMEKYRPDWPKWPSDLNYDTLESWYCQAEREIGVSGSREEQSIASRMTFSTDYPMPAIRPSLTDRFVSEAIDGMVIHGQALKVRSTPAARNSQPFKNRRVCAGNTNCIPICPIQAKYDPTITLRDAEATGHVKFMYRTVATKVVVDEHGRVSQINYRPYHPDGTLGEEGHVSAKVYVIAGNAIETPRLLLMSDDRLPTGVANRSDQVGRNLMDHPYYVPWGLLPQSTYPYRGPLSTSGIEDLRDGDFRKEQAAFRIEIGNEGWNFAIGGDPNITTLDFVNGLNNSKVNKNYETLFGDELVGRLNSILTRQFRLGFLVEQEPEEKNRVGLSAYLDGMNLPRPEVYYSLSEYTLKGLAAAKQTADAIFARLNVTPYTFYDEDDPSVVELPPNPAGIRQRVRFMGAGHIIGTYRMGDDPQKSVVDSYQRTHDHEHLYLIGSGVFPTSATGNPTLTIAALALRTAERILQKEFA
jgi:choline dehydrogenase-like flavoprotein